VNPILATFTSGGSLNGESSQIHPKIILNHGKIISKWTQIHPKSHPNIPKVSFSIGKKSLSLGLAPWHFCGGTRPSARLWRRSSQASGYVTGGLLGIPSPMGWNTKIPGPGGRGRCDLGSQHVASYKCFISHLLGIFHVCPTRIMCICMYIHTYTYTYMWGFHEWWYPNSWKVFLIWK